jgi:hypothetical protein
VTPGGKGKMIIGQPDVGKTALTLMFARENGYSIVGDDTFDLSKDGTVYRNQETMGIFPHPENLKGLKLSLGEKLVAFLKRLIFVYPPFSHMLYPNLRVGYDRFDRVSDQGKLDQIFILERGVPEVAKIGEDEAARKIISTSLDLAIPGGFPHRMFYRYTFFNDISPVFVEKQYEKIIQSAIKDKQAFVVRGQSPHDFYKFLLEHEED